MAATVMLFARTIQLRLERAATCYHIFDPRHWFNVDSHLDLNLCIGYQGGNLIPGNHYTESCAQCFLIDTFLQCGCGGPSPAAHKSGINLDEFIENSHGVLKCFGNTGIDDDRVPHTANVTATANTTCAGDNASFCPNIDVHEG
ncbi:hypothetical protein B0T26DRAFT_872280 [Lasiosphaeria miniovina]|uniref:Cyanovirin-N domain-containing protein n=1 Tax=Lasiosphaeria miniovina TaxID=1954250 RepID=A0AA40DYU4_9PEZI|nr:uncharacterized protein B0T26DRAFT_872280 [Lasiosphaeria miniovina]KAK0717966.1 hypothetical protein B0T26DRAFT_872280 [Lasiosphaeria miniovina]